MIGIITALAAGQCGCICPPLRLTLSHHPPQANTQAHLEHTDARCQENVTPVRRSAASRFLSAVQICENDWRERCKTLKLDLCKCSFGGRATKCVCVFVVDNWMPIGERISFAVKVFIAEFLCHAHTHVHGCTHTQVNETIKGENGTSTVWRGPGGEGVWGRRSRRVSNEMREQRSAGLRRNAEEKAEQGTKKTRREEAVRGKEGVVGMWGKKKQPWRGKGTRGVAEVEEEEEEEEEVSETEEAYGGQSCWVI